MLHRRAPGGAQSAAQGIILEHAHGGRCQRGRVFRINEQAGFALADGLGDPAGAAADHGKTARSSLHTSDSESLHQQVVSPGREHEHVRRVVQRRQLRVGNETQQAHRIAQTELRDERVECIAPAPHAGDGVARARNGGPDRGERPDDGVDPLVEVEPGDREQPRASLEPVLATHRQRVDAGVEMGGRRTEVDDADIGGERGATEGLENVAGEIRGPPAVGDHYRTAFEDAPRRPPLEARATHLRLEQQQVRAVRQYAEGYPAARVQPRRGVSRGLDLVAPGKRRLGPAR